MVLVKVVYYKLLALVVHAVMFESGFVAYDPAVSSS